MHCMLYELIYDWKIVRAQEVAFNQFRLSARQPNIVYSD